MSSRVNPVLVGLHVLGLCSSQESPFRGVCSQGGSPPGHELRAAPRRSLSSPRPPPDPGVGMGTSGELCPRGCAYMRGVSSLQTGAMAPQAGPEWGRVAAGGWSRRLGRRTDRPRGWEAGGARQFLEAPKTLVPTRGGLPRLYSSPLLSSGKILIDRVECVNPGCHLNCQVHCVGLTGRWLWLSCSGRWRC